MFELIYLEIEPNVTRSVWLCKAAMSKYRGLRVWVASDMAWRPIDGAGFIMESLACLSCQ